MAATLTRGDIRQDISRVLGLDNTSGSDEEDYANRKIQQGVLDMVARTKLTMRSLDIDLAPSTTGVYDMPMSIITMNALYGEDGHRMIQVADDEVSEPSHFAVIGYDLLKVVPSTVDRTFTSYYVPQVSEMTDDSNSPAEEAYGGIPPQYLMGIIWYACWMSADYTDDESSQMGERYRILYEGAYGSGGIIGRIRKETNRRIMPSQRRRAIVDGYEAVSYFS